MAETKLRAVPSLDVSGKLPPHDENAQRAVISAIVTFRDGVDIVSPIVEPRDFYGRADGLVYAAALAVRRRGEPVDSVAIIAELRDRGTLATVGDSGTITDLLHNGPALNEKQVRNHARIIADHARVRRVIEATRLAAAEGYYDVGDVNDWLASVQDRIREAAGTNPTETIARNLDRLKALFVKLKANADRKCVRGITSGIASFDSMLGGFRIPQVTIVGARPSMGKTALATCMAMSAAESGVGVLFMSIEQSADEILLRALSARSGVPSAIIESGGMSAAQWARVTNEAKALAKLPLLIDDGSELTPNRLRATVLRCMREFESEGTPLGLVVVDYLQKMRPNPENAKLPREQQVAGMSAAFKPIAKDAKVSFLLLSQLNRQSVTRSEKSKRPSMSDLRESGAVEQDADNIALLHRDAYHDKSKPDDRRAELIVDKQRNGPTGIVRMRFEGPVYRFSDASTDDCSGRFDDEGGL